MIDKLMKFISNPYVAATVGGAASYYLIGKKKKGNQPYYWAGGGAVAGYLVGRMFQAQAAKQQQSLSEYQAVQAAKQLMQKDIDDKKFVELDVDRIFNQPPPTAEDVDLPRDEEITSETDRSYMNMNESDLGELGSLGGSPLGSNGLGSFDRPDGFDGDDPRIPSIIREAKKEFGAN